MHNFIFSLEIMESNYGVRLFFHFLIGEKICNFAYGKKKYFIDPCTSTEISHN